VLSTAFWLALSVFATKSRARSTYKCTTTIFPQPLHFLRLLYHSLPRPLLLLSTAKTMLNISRVDRIYPQQRPIKVGGAFAFILPSLEVAVRLFMPRTSPSCASIFRNVVASVPAATILAGPIKVMSWRRHLRIQEIAWPCGPVSVVEDDSEDPDSDELPSRHLGLRRQAFTMTTADSAMAIIWGCSTIDD